MPSPFAPFWRQRLLSMRPFSSMTSRLPWHLATSSSSRSFCRTSSPTFHRRWTWPGSMLASRFIGTTVSTACALDRTPLNAAGSWEGSSSSSRRPPRSLPLLWALMPRRSSKCWARCTPTSTAPTGPWTVPSWRLLSLLPTTTSRLSPLRARSTSTTTTTPWKSRSATFQSGSECSLAPTLLPLRPRLPHMELPRKRSLPLSRTARPAMALCRVDSVAVTSTPPRTAALCRLCVASPPRAPTSCCTSSRLAPR